MGIAHRRRTRSALQRCLLLLAVLVAVLASTGLSSCGSASSHANGASADPVRTAITRELPRDASAEPPWNGRFVQVNVRVAKPGAMKPGDWHVYVNGKEPELDKSPSVLPYAPSEAIVAFVFRAPFGDLGTYRFRVVYAPEDGQKVRRSWEYRW